MNKIPEHIAENPPLYDRTEYVLWDKQHKILLAQQKQSAQKNQDFMENCTFEPSLQLTRDFNEVLLSSRNDKKESPGRRLMKWGDERDINLKKKKLQKEAQKNIERGKYTKPLTERQYKQTTDRFSWQEKQRKEKIQNMIDEKLDSLFKPHITETKRGGSRRQRKKLREQGEWFGYKSKPTNHSEQILLTKHHRNKSALLLKKGMQEPDSNRCLYSRHEMSTRYEQELDRKLANTLFKSKSQKLIRPRSKSATHHKEYRKVYIERKKAAQRKKENIRKKREQLKRLKMAIEAEKNKEASHSEKILKRSNKSLQKSKKSREEEYANEYNHVNDQIDKLEKQLKNYLHSPERKKSQSQKKRKRSKSKPRSKLRKLPLNEHKHITQSFWEPKTHSKIQSSKRRRKAKSKSRSRSYSRSQSKGSKKKGSKPKQKLRSILKEPSIRTLTTENESSFDKDESEGKKKLNTQEHNPEDLIKIYSTGQTAQPQYLKPYNTSSHRNYRNSKRRSKSPISRSRSRKKIKVPVKQAKGYRIAFQKELSPPKKHFSRQADPNYGAPLKYYLKELDDKAIAHNPNNKLIVDDQGIFKIMLQRDNTWIDNPENTYNRGRLGPDLTNFSQKKPKMKNILSDQIRNNNQKPKRRRNKKLMNQIQKLYETIKGEDETSYA